MAQISKGIRLVYGKQGEGPTQPSSWTEIPDIKSIPALGSTPNTIQTTTLADDMHTYIKGLQDIGGALEFTANYTPELITAMETAITAQGTGVIVWAVEFPAPLNKRVYWEGEAEMPFNTEVAVDAVVEATVAIVPNSVIEIEDIE